MRVFRVPMNRWVIFGFFLAVAVVAAATAWAFRSGLTWTGICLIAVAGPLSLLYWYMLLVNPARAEVRLGEEGLHVLGPPFLDLAVPWEAIQEIRSLELNGDHDLAVRDSKRGMKFGGYRCGVFSIKNGETAHVLGNKNQGVLVRTSDTRILLAPDDPDEFFNALEARDYQENGEPG
ncbi:PH domain-containing protein [Paucidesulfovibrio gracilis DSM 16080]|uniref:PH domain-containing protein n=1 Tax=Paucidesulfovibrio gracilis DSM 16080 TaxID=1121449 RepID=A0A1T4WXF9_9BACT|nr:PH domain-containing protein [Paucidesulfovibrio gracilis]SKA81827.1 PH domain-containing protein [Paucidesulfovibrio gracilis DSM 16080]